MIDAEDEGAVLTEDEVLINAAGLLAAGHFTTANLLGNGLLALLRHPDQLRRLREEPALLPGAVQELLRYESPVQAIGRVALEDLELDDKKIAGGERVLLVVGSANHDPARFPKPDRLDITRGGGQHLAFGHGSHFCIGAMPARLDAELALAELPKLEDLHLEVEEPEWTASLGFRCLKIAFQP